MATVDVGFKTRFHIMGFLGGSDITKAFYMGILEMIELWCYGWAGITKGMSLGILRLQTRQSA